VPTRAHRGALRLFRTIVTTNYDDLFERAAGSVGDGRPIVESELVERRLPEPVLVKFHGSFSRPETLVLGEREVLGLDRGRKHLWGSLVALLRERPLVVVGSSLHDASLVRLCLEVGDSLRGWFEAPGLSATAARRFAAWNLKTVCHCGRVPRRTDDRGGARVGAGPCPATVGNSFKGVNGNISGFSLRFSLRNWNCPCEIQRDIVDQRGSRDISSGRILLTLCG